MRVKMSKPPPPAPTASAIGPCPTIIKIVGRPGTESLPSTIAPPDHPLLELRSGLTLANGRDGCGKAFFFAAMHVAVGFLSPAEGGPKAEGDRFVHVRPSGAIIT